MPHETPIGIDLGTTNSAMARLNDAGHSEMIANAEGEYITPSVVFFNDAEVVIGKNARTAITAHPDMVAQWVKRDMGSPFYTHPIRGRYLPPEVIQACILRKLKADVVQAAGPDIRTVITVPAYFDEPRRKATADAGEMAGLRVLDIVNEPTAAALSFGEALGFLSPSGQPEQEMNVLVYDLGGGTFDVTLLSLAPGRIRTLATDGDVQLGGHDWDRRLVDYAADTFWKCHQLDPRQDPATLNRLYQDAMEAKHSLTARSRTTLQVDYKGKSSEIQLSRDQFEEMTADLLERTAYTSRQLVKTAGLDWPKVDRVLLVGGSTRMPMVPQMLEKLTGLKPDHTVNPDEAVARGAAIYAGYQMARQGAGMRPSFVVTNVNAHSLGVEGIDPDTLRKKNVTLIPRNTALPTKHTERFATKAEGQRIIVIKVLEGESSQPSDCITIGRTAVRDLPAGLPKGWPVEITFEYGDNGRLAVRAVVPGTHHAAVLDLEREVGMTGDGLSRWKSPISAAAGFEAFEVAALEILKEMEDSPSHADGADAAENSQWSLPDDGRKTPEIKFPKPDLAVPKFEEPKTPKPPAGEASAGAARGGEAGKNPDVSEFTAGKRKRKREPWLPLWLSRLIGHTIAAALGLGVGYYILSRLQPENFPFPPHWLGF
jgi:molecular chaperone DnaK